MSQQEKTLFTTQEAMEYLKMSRGTFFSRLREKQIKPANYNPALRKQPNPLFRKSDLDSLKVATPGAERPWYIPA